jgi:hypothetical protein
MRSVPFYVLAGGLDLRAIALMLELPTNFAVPYRDVGVSYSSALSLLPSEEVYHLTLFDVQTLLRSGFSR